MTLNDPPGSLDSNRMPFFIRKSDGARPGQFAANRRRGTLLDSLLGEDSIFWHLMDSSFTLHVTSMMILVIRLCSNLIGRSPDPEILYKPLRLAQLDTSLSSFLFLCVYDSRKKYVSAWRQWPTNPSSSRDPGAITLLRTLAESNFALRNLVERDFE